MTLPKFNLRFFPNKQGLGGGLGGVRLANMHIGFHTRILEYPLNVHQMVNIAILVNR